ncbi:hypothetical protein, partial [Dysgonomonas sp. 511]|uniref:hypothetical protein n=1 Tax=Dysgonomonas sp. 511 TaxID=2302930 RepID=UPI0013D30487
DIADSSAPSGFTSPWYDNDGQLVMIGAEFQRVPPFAGRYYPFGKQQKRYTGADAGTDTVPFSMVIISLFMIVRFEFRYFACTQ